jgi:hypothetical protein
MKFIIWRTMAGKVGSDPVHMLLLILICRELWHRGIKAGSDPDLCSICIPDPTLPAVHTRISVTGGGHHSCIFLILLINIILINFN